MILACVKLMEKLISKSLKDLPLVTCLQQLGPTSWGLQLPKIVPSAGEHCSKHASVEGILDSSYNRKQGEEFSVKGLQGWSKVNNSSNNKNSPKIKSTMSAESTNMLSTENKHRILVLD